MNSFQGCVCVCVLPVDLIMNNSSLVHLWNEAASRTKDWVDCCVRAREIRSYFNCSTDGVVSCSKNVGRKSRSSPRNHVKARIKGNPLVTSYEVFRGSVQEPPDLQSEELHVVVTEIRVSFHKCVVVRGKKLK